MNRQTKRLSPEEQVKIIESIFRVPRYGSTSYVDFILNGMQLEVINAKAGRNIILKARKEGMSTLVLAIAIIHCQEFKNMKAVFLADNEPNTVAIFEKAKNLINHAKYKFNVRIGKKDIAFVDTGSRIAISTAGRKSAFRGDDVHFVHFSEIAFFEYPDVSEAVLEACHKYAQVYMESTANGRNLYFDLWEKAQGYPDTFNFKPFFFGWNLHPEYTRVLDGPIVLTEEEQTMKQEHDLTDEQIAWRRWKLNDMPDPDKFPQEYPLTANEAFLASGKPVFLASSLGKMKNTALDYRQGVIEKDRKNRIAFTDDKSGNWQIYKMPDKCKEYVVGADCAEGKAGGDFNVASVWDPQTAEQVAEFHGKCDPDQFAIELNKGGRYYNTALMAPERNGAGYSVISDLYNDYEYPRMFQEQDNADNFVDEASDRLGFRTNVKTRDMIITNAKRLIRTGVIKINSNGCINECLSFVVNLAGKPEHDKGKHDDRVFAMMIALHCIDIYPEIKDRVDGKDDSAYYRNCVRNPERPSKNKGSIGGY